MQTITNQPGADMNIGKSLKIALLQNDMEQADLANRMGIHQSNISRIACCKTITTETLERIAKAFDMKVSEFVAIGED
jgi:DNA-binding Xre family transcriptional regulator